MSERTKVLVLRVTALVGGLLAASSIIPVVARVGIGGWLTGFSAFIILFAIFFAVSVWLLAPRQSGNAVIWTMASAALFGGFTEWGHIATVMFFGVDPAQLENLPVPAELPAAAARVLLLTAWTWVPAMIPLLTYGLLLFPDGKPPSPRWRGVAFYNGFALVALSAASIWSYRPSNQMPAESNAGVYLGFGLVAIAAVLSMAALITRFRRSVGLPRQQIKLVLWGALVFMVIFMGLGFALGGEENEYLLVWPIMIAEAIFLLSYAVAIGKYRLYDIDLVISRSLVYGSLAVLITLFYVGVVVGGSLALGVEDGPNAWLGIVATVAIAIAFQPLRRRLQRVANRLVFGRRATPYEVLSSFSQRIDAVDPDLAKTVARSLAEGTAATGVGIWTVSDGRLRREAVWPDGPGVADTPGLADRSWEITHDGELLGYVGLSFQAGQTLAPHDEKLVAQVTAGLGLALRNLELTADLESRVEQLRESRRRIVSVQDQTRRRLERDLHDGAQQRLVALKIKLGIAASMAGAEGHEEIKQILDVVKEEADLTIDSVRTLARGIYPPLLEAEGLGPALTAQLLRIPIPVTVQAAGVTRHTRDIEATVYFCVLEAVQNSVKHAQAKSVLVAVGDRNGFLDFEVRDDGVGFDPDDEAKGPGLTNIADRLDALGGVLEVDAAPGRGTRIGGRIPIRDEVPA